MAVDDHDERCSKPLNLDRTTRTVICTADTPADLASPVQCAIGEYSSASDELHLSHAIASDHRTGPLLLRASRTQTGPKHQLRAAPGGNRPLGVHFRAAVPPAARGRLHWPSIPSVRNETADPRSTCEAFATTRQARR